MISERQIKRVIEGAGYKVLGIDRGKHYKATVSDAKGQTIKVAISMSPRSQSHWPAFVLADIKKRMR